MNNSIISFILIKTFKLLFYFPFMKEEEKKERKKESKFTVSITGKNINFEVPVNSIEDFVRVEEILDILRRKI